MTLKENKIAQCEAFLYNIKLLHKTYKSLTNPNHKKVFEFGIASIITSITNRTIPFWSGKISEGLLLAMRDLNQTTFSADHDPARHKLAIRYLNGPKYERITLADFINEFEELVKFNMVTSKENQNLKNKTYEEVGYKLTIMHEYERKIIFSNTTPIKEKRELINELLDRIKKANQI